MVNRNAPTSKGPIGKFIVLEKAAKKALIIPGYVGLERGAQCYVFLSKKTLREGLQCCPKEQTCCSYRHLLSTVTNLLETKRNSLRGECCASPQPKKEGIVFP